MTLRSRPSATPNVATCLRRSNTDRRHGARSSPVSSTLGQVLEVQQRQRYPRALQVRVHPATSGSARRLPTGAGRSSRSVSLSCSAFSQLRTMELARCFRVTMPVLAHALRAVSRTPHFQPPRSQISRTFRIGSPSAAIRPPWSEADVSWGDARCDRLEPDPPRAVQGADLGVEAPRDCRSRYRSPRARRRARRSRCADLSVHDPPMRIGALPTATRLREADTSCSAPQPLLHPSSCSNIRTASWLSTPARRSTGARSARSRATLQLLPANLFPSTCRAALAQCVNVATRLAHLVGARQFVERGSASTALI
jgi:hypothetical protein